MNMTKCELARYLIDAKKEIDSIMFISDNTNKMSNLSIRNLINTRLQTFYLSIRVIYDKSFSKKEKITLKNKDDIVNAIFIEADKNFAHKDEEYFPKQYKNLNELVRILQNRLERSMEICKENLPEVITLNYVPHDKDLFRLLNNITPNVEKKLNKMLHPFYNEDEKWNRINKNLFEDTEDIKFINNPQDYAVEIDDGLNDFERLQNRQDFCIKINVLFGLDVWCQPDKDFWKYNKKTD